MITELCTNEFVIYEVKKREPKDALSIRKIQKDMRKLETWIHALLEKNEVIIFYMENGEEKIVVASRIPPYEGYVLPETPLEDEIVNGVVNKVSNYCCFFIVPERVPAMIHFDDITKFIVKIDKVREISNSLR